ncbi:hypothetical protein MMC13_002813 [Lambiella insularis]|nr:hypothetical protein [Lambiella insularis]
MAAYCINLDADHNRTRSDVRTYVISRVGEIASKKSIPQDVIEEIVSSVEMKSLDNFLAAKLILQELDSYRPAQSVIEVIRLIRAISGGLSHIYSNTLERMYPSVQAQMIRVLYFVMNAKTVLNLSKLSALVALSRCERPTCVDIATQEGIRHEIQVSSRRDISGNAPAELERDIRKFCSTMLIVNGAEVVLLTQESQDFAPSGDGQGVLRKVPSLMAELCLHYIFASHEKDIDEDEFDFIEYACLYWPEHLRDAGEAVSSRVCDLVKELLCSESGYFSFWETRIARNELVSLGTRSLISRMATTLSAFDLWDVLGDRLGLSHYDTLEDQDHPGRTPFHIAAAFDAICSIKYIWNHSTRHEDLSMLIRDVNCPLSPLHQAVANGHLETVQTLLDYISTELAFSDSLFQLVSDSGRTDFFELFLSRTKPVDNRDRSAVLRYAIKLDFVKRIEELADPLTVTETDKNGISPLHLAIGQGSYTICKFLLEKDASLCQSNDKRDTPIHTASAKGDTRIVRLLIENGASVNRDNQDGRTPLHAAAAAGHVETLEALLEAGANVFATDHKDQTALHLSAQIGAEANVKILLRYGTQINPLDEGCRTPLHHAVQADNESSLPIMYLLLEAGALIDIKDKEGMTPLQLAASQGSPDLVVDLLELGANLRAVDGKGRDPADCARANGHASIAKLISKFVGEIRQERQWSDLESP